MAVVLDIELIENHKDFNSLNATSCL